MNLHATTLCGAALAALLTAAPALAQQDPYHTNPTPQERQQTDQLNAAAAANAQNAVNQTDAAAAAARARDAAQQADYRRKLQDTQAGQAAYDRERARYDATRGDTAHRWDVFYGHLRFREVPAMRGTDIVGLKVSARGGDGIGRVRSVDTNAYGRITRVAVGNADGAVTWIDADDLRYDPATRAVVSDLSRDQIDGMARMRYPRF